MNSPKLLQNRVSKKAGTTKGGLNKMNIGAAGIDIGSREHYVCALVDKQQIVRKFGCYTPDLQALSAWLSSCKVKTIAMESTGVYWIPVYEVLVANGFEVKLVEASHVKNVPGRKTDVQDCQWIQELHTYGLLEGSFIPAPEICVLRSYWRQRAGIVRCCARQINLMQKSLEQMNVQLHKAISDITGVTGMNIIRAIISGQHNPKNLSQLKITAVKCDEETLEKALTGNYREDHVFSLRQAVEVYDFYQEQLSSCEQIIQICLNKFESKGEPSKVNMKHKPNKRSRRKNEPKFDLHKELYRISGVDLTKIDGIDVLTAMTIIAELGTDISPFPSEKHFSSWLGLCPNNRITGGKVKSRNSRRVQNKIACALRQAAQGLHSSKSALGAYYRRQRSRLGAPKAITATAHKLARLVFRMLKHGEEYVDRGEKYYEDQYQSRVIKNLQKRAKDFGLVLIPKVVPQDVGA